MLLFADSHRPPTVCTRRRGGRCGREQGRLCPQHSTHCSQSVLRRPLGQGATPAPLVLQSGRGLESVRDLPQSPRCLGRGLRPLISKSLHNPASVSWRKQEEGTPCTPPPFCTHSGLAHTAPFLGITVGTPLRGNSQARLGKGEELGRGSAPLERSLLSCRIFLQVLADLTQCLFPSVTALRLIASVTSRLSDTI